MRGVGLSASGASRSAERLAAITLNRHRSEVLLTELDLAQQPPAAQVQEALREVDVARLVQGAAQLHQRGLHLGVTAHGVPPALAEDLAQVVGDLHCGGRELVGPGGAQARHGCLEHVPGAVQLVPPLEVRVARLLPLLSEPGVEVPVGLLGRDDRSGQLAGAAVHVQIAGAADIPGHRLHQLVHVGIGELPSLAHGRDGAVHSGAGVFHPAELLHPGLGVRDGGAGVALGVRGAGAAGDGPGVGAENAADEEA